MELTTRYQQQLDLVRQNPGLLNQYVHDKNAADSNHSERLRLNIALYNNFRHSDFEIAAFLFREELKWRKEGTDGDVDNFYFSAFLLTLFQAPRFTALFWEAKNIDFDCGIGFDGEYLVAAGIEKTYAYLETVDFAGKEALLKYIGRSTEHCVYSQEEIDHWSDWRKAYFRCYQYPITDIVYFLYSVNEKSLFLKVLPPWIAEDRDWTPEELGLFRTYAAYTGDKALQVEAGELIVKKNDKSFLDAIYRKELAALYIDVGRQEEALQILRAIIKSSDNKNTIWDCIEQLCRIIISNGENINQTSLSAFEIVKRQQRKHKNFSPLVDALIKDASAIITSQKATACKKGIAHDGREGKTRTLWECVRQWFGRQRT